jgi:DNA-binding NarL/FixJ family response regulator
MTRIRIAIADDYQVYRDGLKVSLSADDNLSVVTEADNGEELLQKLETVTPDVIIMDLKMPVMDGMEATKRVREQYPGIKVLVVTMYDDDRFITHVMELGAGGYLLKNAEPEEILKAIYAVHENGYYFNDVVSKALLKNLVTKNDIQPSFKQGVELTGNELRILKLICEEKTFEEIGDELSLDTSLVLEIHEQLVHKIGVHNTAGLVMFAVKNKLVD